MRGNKVVVFLGSQVDFPVHLHTFGSSVPHRDNACHFLRRESTRRKCQQVSGGSGERCLYCGEPMYHTLAQVLLLPASLCIFSLQKQDIGLISESGNFLLCMITLYNSKLHCEREQVMFYVFGLLAATCLDNSHLLVGFFVCYTVP